MVIFPATILLPAIFRLLVPGTYISTLTYGRSLLKDINQQDVAHKFPRAWADT